MFEDLQASAKDSSLKAFLDQLQEQHIGHFNEYLLFNVANMETTFFNNLAFLADDDIWTKEELKEYSLVAQTIDNDYILATDEAVLIIPSSLNKKDSEKLPLSIWNFFKAFEDKTLESNILSIN